jgi:hypothetical protein
MVNRCRVQIKGMERSQEAELVTKSRLNKYRSRVRKYMAYLQGRRAALAEEMAALMPPRREDSMHSRKGSKGNVNQVIFLYLYLIGCSLRIMCRG